MRKSEKVAYYGIFAALAILMGYVERLIQLPFGIPGIKLGLANVVVLIVLYRMGEKPALCISLVRILISGILFSGFSGFLYSTAGALCSYFAMLLLKRTNLCSIIGVSVIGGVFHNIGQIITASFVLKTTGLFYTYLPALIVSGVITGVLIGIVGERCLWYLERKKGKGAV